MNTLFTNFQTHQHQPNICINNESHLSNTSSIQTKKISQKHKPYKFYTQRTHNPDHEHPAEEPFLCNEKDEFGRDNYLYSTLSPKNKNKIDSNCRKASAFVLKEEINLVPVDPKRVSRYNTGATKESNISKSEDKPIKWEYSISKYMESRNKMSKFFQNPHNGEFDSLQLNRKNTILQNRKFEQVQMEAKNNKGLYSHKKSYSLGDASKEGVKPGQEFLSHLYHYDEKRERFTEGNSMENEAIKNSINKTEKEIKRGDVLLVSFVSTYFRRKFYSKNKKVYSFYSKKNKTNMHGERELVGLEGKSINENVINDIIGNVVKEEEEERKKSEKKNKNNTINKVMTNK